MDGNTTTVTTPNVVAGKSVVHLVDEVGRPCPRQGTGKQSHWL